jgi:uncharacterized linocin/CFP29 family protein
VSHLLRSHAPVTESAWELIDAEAKERLVPALAARKLVEFAGPKGWAYSSTNLGRTEPVAETPVKGLTARRRQVLPLVELRADFSIDRQELLNADRGADDLDLVELVDAAQRMAEAENVAVFHGWSAVGIDGIAQGSPYKAITLGKDFAGYPAKVAKAVEVLLEAGVSGPYGLALGPDGYTGVIETTEHGGLVVFDHLRQILGGPIIWAPGVRGAVVVSQRGGDYVMECGEDLSIGYSHHDAERVHLYLEESFSFRSVSPDAAVCLK